MYDHEWMLDLYTEPAKLGLSEMCFLSFASQPSLPVKHDKKLGISMNGCYC